MLRDKKFRLYLLSFFIFGFLFFLVATFANHPFVSALNLFLLHHIYNFASGVFFPFFSKLTLIGSTEFCFMLIIPLMVLLGLSKKYAGMLMVPLSIFGSDDINSWLKAIYKHPRPDVPHLVVAHDYSFPSGHSMNMVAFYGLLTFLLLEGTKGRIARMTIWLLSALVILLVGLSRVYLGVHFPIDVIGGYFIGFAWLQLVLATYLILKKDRHPKTPAN
jgi:undecaprenyl-diphosphatase